MAKWGGATQDGTGCVDDQLHRWERRAVGKRRSGEVTALKIYLDKDERTSAEGGDTVRCGPQALTRIVRQAPQEAPVPADGQQDIRVALHGNPEVHRYVKTGRFQR
jgi:hypothetical protein